ncbi:DNA-processing protein DprA [Micromonospora sp. NPDC005806]|uniref:DNA-processing protein DprA n=1 Tax=Micromonospora sp. NPDC005806 TaxID=3364234 RepID=UPI0036929ACF
MDSNMHSNKGATMGSSLAEQAAVLALTRVSPGEWYKTATVIYEAGSATALLEGRIGLMADEHRLYAEQLVERAESTDITAAEHLIERMAQQGIKLLTVLDDDYPSNLQLIYNRPPFIWLKGELRPQDFRAIAIVGTRQASDEGRKRAARLARELAMERVTVLSGLARGIDTAAHTATLAADGRTVGVIGQGLCTPLYPKENRGLGTEISEKGALVSQFWPDAPPRSMNFPMRNVVMSGMAMGTVVVEASATSGAKMQARLALEHGKRLFLLESLVRTQEWAKRYATRPGVRVVRQLDDVLDVLVKLATPPEQLTLKM